MNQNAILCMCKSQLEVCEKPLISSSWITQQISPHIIEKGIYHKEVFALMHFMNPSEDYDMNGLSNGLGFTTHGNLSMELWDRVENAPMQIPPTSNVDSSNIKHTKGSVIGTLHVEIEILDRTILQKEFYQKYRKKKSNQINLQSNKFRASKVHEIFLCLEFELQVLGKTISETKLSLPLSSGDEKKGDDNDKNLKTQSQTSEKESNDWNDIWVDVKVVSKILNEHKWETSVPLTYYLYEYLKIKHQPINAGSKITEISSFNDILDAGWWVRFFKPPFYGHDKEDLFVVDRFFIFICTLWITYKNLTTYQQTKKDELDPNRAQQELNQLAQRRVLRLEFFLPFLDLVIKLYASKLSEKESSKHIGNFARLNHVNMSDFELSSISAYKTLQSFFARKMATKYKTDDEDAVLCPVNGRIVVYETLKDCQDLWIQDSKFTLSALVGEDILLSLAQQMSSTTSNWAILGARIASHDYLGVHIPATGRIIDIQEKSGIFFCVTPMPLNQEWTVLTEIPRTTIVMQTEVGIVILILLTSLEAYRCQLFCKSGDFVNQGDLIAFYELLMWWITGPNFIRK
ncbi:phosphatidylserine decarboxylase [Reticulomyxa filosa]|uniref:Phosphatidylserine decarboxylase n=1 Tax=Reticulomyxa filosa TaxID=46433 RepID=X6P580_RETFI|nr:phosphatidylserine decarboxylase [Reticulomyxa filosa]|eukprot:ETO32747.1 phosphatidylserine decarboxylase [Reticulomyxa filosa]